MLKKRIIATLIIKDDIVVQSFNFKRYLPIGKPQIAVEYLNYWGVDEIVILDIDASKNNKEPNFKEIKEIASKCFVPLTIGGGINSIDHIKQLMHCGADKISINNIAINNPDFIQNAAHIFGNQCIVISVDAVKINNDYFVYDYKQKNNLQVRITDFVKQMEDRGAGEIIINSVDNDGSYKGFDTELINEVCTSTTIPIICSGGAKNANDFINVFEKTNVNAASASNFFHFTEHSVIITKSNILKKMPIRLETAAKYAETSFDQNLRIQKKDDKILDELLYEKIIKEII